MLGENLHRREVMKLKYTPCFRKFSRPKSTLHFHLLLFDGSIQSAESIAFVVMAVACVADK